MRTVALAAFQSFGIAVALQKQVAAGGAPVVYTPGFGFIMSSVVGLTAGTMFLMWLGEQMTERGIGNGISLLIFAGIVAGLPGAVVHTLGMASNGELSADHVADGVRSDSGGDRIRGVHGARPAAHHGELRAASGWAESLHEPELEPAAEDQHGGRDSADLRFQPADVPGHGDQLVQHGSAVALVAGSDRSR